VKNINVPASQSTPAIQGDWQAGVLKMQGDSYPENAFELFGEIIQWVDDFLAQSVDPLRLELQLLYLNTSSIKAMMDIFDLLEDAHVKGRAVSVGWRYDKRNERLAELAEEFKEDCTFPFLIVSHE
jgi:hypothetical protein